MKKLTLKELAVPIIKSIDSFNFLLKSHHRRTAIIAYMLGVKLGLNENELSDLVIAASIHDIGALSIQERDMLIRNDVENPTPHCIMGYKMLMNFEAFHNIALIIKHHHIKFNEKALYVDEEIPYQCFIIHLADRIDVYTDPHYFILDQKSKITEMIKARSGTDFDPDIVKAFEEISQADIFWIHINTMTLDKLFSKIKFNYNYQLNIKRILDFAQTISRVIDFRSPYTAAHSCSVAHVAEAVGKWMNLDKETTSKLLIAGYLHDIGKIGIDPTLLEKPTPLTSEEYNQMKLHSYYSGQILSELNQSDWFRPIVTWAELHHEKTDGSGYPYSFKGEDICDEVKILAFGDIITALLENRPYRKKKNLNEAFEILKKNFADKLSYDIYHVIEAHKNEVEDIVMYCQNRATKIYELDI